MDDVKTTVLKEYGRAQNYYDTAFRQNSEQAYQYYNGDKPGIIDEDIEEFFEGIVSPDVQNVVDHTLADIMPAFAAESPVAFIPSGAQDELQAQVETQTVNNIFFQQSNGYVQLLSAAQDAMLRGLGAIEVQTNKKLSVSYMTVPEMDMSILASYMQDPSVALSKINDQLVDDLTEEETTEILQQPFSAELRKTTELQELYVDAFPPDELLFLPEEEEVDFDNSTFVARNRLMTRSELVTLGYSRTVVDALPAFNTRGSTQPHRQRTGDASEDSSSNTDYINTAFIYMQLDEDNDGIAELRRIVLAGNLPSEGELLEDKPVAAQPFAVGVPYIYAHRTVGVSLYEKIKQVQDIKTKVTRQLLTAGERAVRGRLGVVGTQVNTTDIKETMFGGIVRMTTPNGLVPIPTDPFPGDVTALLEIADKQRRESGGSAVDKASEEIAVGGDTAHGLERMMSAMEQLNSLVAKLLAETLVRQVYRKIHYNLRTYFGEETETQSDGVWHITTPSRWPERKYVASALGLTMGDRMRQAAAYDRLLIDHKELLTQGSTLVTENSLYTLLTARANALMIPGAHSYYINPQSPEGQQAAQAKQQQMQQQQEAEEQEKQRQHQLVVMQYQTLLQVENIKAQSDSTIQEMKNHIKQMELQMEQTAEKDDLTLSYDELKLKLVELNAKHDNEKVPNVV